MDISLDSGKSPEGATMDLSTTECTVFTFTKIDFTSIDDVNPKYFNKTHLDCFLNDCTEGLN